MCMNRALGHHVKLSASRVPALSSLDYCVSHHRLSCRALPPFLTSCVPLTPSHIALHSLSLSLIYTYTHVAIACPSCCRRTRHGYMSSQSQWLHNPTKASDSLAMATCRHSRHGYTIPRKLMTHSPWLHVATVAMATHSLRVS